MGRHRSRLRILVGILKDKSSTLKTLLCPRRSTKLRLAILRATSHVSPSSPSNRSVSAVLSLGDGSRRTAGTCIKSLMDRLHGSKNAYVVLKCLFTIHAIVSKGSFILKDQMSVYPASGGRNFLNLSKFRDGSDPETWELSSWVRWYAAVIEQNLAVSRTLGRFLSCATTTSNSSSNGKVIMEKLNTDLQKEIQVLVDFVQLICEAPRSLELRSNNLVYEVVKSVGEDYRLVQREIAIRVGEFRDRVQGLSFDELTLLLSELKRLIDSREGVSSLFGNGKRNDALWETVAEAEKEMEEAMMEKDEMKKLVPVLAASRLWGWRPTATRTVSGELKRVDKRISGSGAWRQSVGSIVWL